MSIKGNLSDGVIDLQAVSVDTILFDKTTRSAITAMSIHSTASADRELFIFLSPNLTSASGTRVARVTLPAGFSVDVNELLGQGIASNEQIIGVQQSAGALAGELNSKITYIEYTGAS